MAIARAAQGRHHAVFPADEERSLVAAFLGGDPGVFVEVGAFDPIYQSQSYHLEISGWDGVLVEPVPDQAENLRATRRAKVFEVACVAPEAAKKPAPLLARRAGSTLHFDPNIVGPAPVIEVRTDTLTDILAEAGHDHVDFLSVDVEGGEPDVLRGFDFKRFRPRLVLVDDRERFGSTCRIMARNSYRLVRRTGHNAWFVPRSASFPLSMRGHFRLSWTYGPGRLARRARGRVTERWDRSGVMDF